MKTHLRSTDSLRIRFWGVRGSLASPGPETARIGGNTSCVQVDAGDETLIFDAGTGIRPCGQRLLRDEKQHISLLFSHLHWDHIQGFPFFVPAYLPTTELSVFGPAPREALEDSLSRQMTPPNFPVCFSDLKSQVTLREVFPGTQRRFGRATVTSARLNHPGGVLGYRVDCGGHSVVYATDHEHSPDADARLVELARGADVLIYDAMYTPEEYLGQSGPSKVGWGHSTFREGARIAREAGVRQLVLFHHDPTRTDSQVDHLVDRARREFSNVIAAREGLVLRPGDGVEPERELTDEPDRPDSDAA